MLIIHKNCDKSLAKDRNLPINSYLIKYLFEDKETFDIVQASSFVEVFDNYYDEYGKNSIKEIKWTDGRDNFNFNNSKSKDNKKTKK